MDSDDCNNFSMNDETSKDLANTKKRVNTPVVVLTISHAVQHFYAAGIALTYPFVIIAFHTSYTILGIYLTIGGVVGGMLQGATWLVRKFSTRAVLGTQNLGLAVAAAIGGASATLGVFGLSRIFAAFVYWPQHPLGSAYLTEHYPSRKASVLSWHTIGGTIGTMSIPLVLSVAIANYGWRTSLYLLGVPLALGGVYVLRYLGADRVQGSDEEKTQRSLADQLRALGNRSSLTVLVTSVISAAGRGLGVLSAYVPAFLHRGTRLSTIDVGIVFTVMSIGGIIGPLLAGRLADQVGRKITLVTTYIFGAVTISVFVMVGNSIWLLCLVGLAVGFFAYSESPLLQAIFSETVVQAESRQAFGLFFAIAYGIGSFWLIVVGAMVDRYGFRPAFFAIAGSFIISAAIITTLPRTPTRR